MASPDPIAQARGWLQAAQRMVMLTGAGVSAESGVPTFLDAQTGHWSRFKDCCHIEDAAIDEELPARNY